MSTHFWSIDSTGWPPAPSPLQTLRARRAPTTVNTPKKPKPITDEDVLALLEEKDREIKALATRLQVLEKLVVREPRFGWRNA